MVHIKCFIVEPDSAAVLSGGPLKDGEHRIQGGGYSMTGLKMLDGVRVDGYLQVTDNDAIHWARRLAAEEGIFGGFSSGANLAAAVKLLQGPCRGGTVAILVCDSGLKYLSTDLWPEMAD